MKKVRDIPPEWQETVRGIQTITYQDHLAKVVAEEGQKTLARRFMSDDGSKDDSGLPLSELDYQLLRANLNKNIPDNLDDKHSIWEEGEEVCYSYGMLTDRGLIQWILADGKKGNKWLFPTTTKLGEEALSHSQAVGA